ncbi:MAG: hypothetical protein FJ102_17185 [Deltaproteobacteria bacterium]|nr:hypothetical protein [Deltaproteobacteria bacterium]
MLFLLLACPSPTDTRPVSVIDTDDTGPGSEADEHCGTIESDTTWYATRAHVVSCDVVVARGTLTIEGGAEVSFDEGTSLSVGTEGYAAGLVIDGEEGGVVLQGTSDTGWDGIVVGELADGVAFRGAVLRGAASGVTVNGVEVEVRGLALDGAADVGLSLLDGARLAEEAEGLAITNAGGYPVVVDVSAVATLPALGSSYSENGSPMVLVEGDEIDASATWEDLGVPYAITDTVDVGGVAGEPAVLTVTEGAEILFDQGTTLRFSRTGSASQLVVEGTGDNPVRMAGLGADVAGYWAGIAIGTGASAASVSWLEISGAGESGGAALSLDDTDLWADHLSITGSEGDGLLMEGTAAFAPGSTDLAVSGCDVPLRLPGAAVSTLPLPGLSLAGNTRDAIAVDGSGKLTESATWASVGLPYWVIDNIELNGDAEHVAVLSIAAGATLLFDTGAGIFVGKDGAAGLVVDGTADAPVTMLPWSAYVAGAWAGIGVYGLADAASVRLSHVDVGYAGGAALRGAVHVDDSSLALDNVYLHDSLEYGLYLTGTATADTSTVTYANNTLGDCSGCE